MSATKQKGERQYRTKRQCSDGWLCGEEGAELTPPMTTARARGSTLAADEKTQKEHTVSPRTKMILTARLESKETVDLW